MTLTASLMADINRWTEIADHCLRDAIQALQDETLAEVTVGMDSPQWRDARKTYARAIAGIKTATSSGYDILDEQARIAASRAKQIAELPPQLLGKAIECLGHPGSHSHAGQ